jgi:U4/U6 small nuclear ribonucleoprotein PRP3
MSRRADAPAAGQPDSKRPHTDAPAPASNPRLDEIRAKLAANKAAVEARLAAARAGQAGNLPSASTSAPAPIPAKPAGPSSLPPVPTMNASVAEKIAASKARIEALHARTSNPYLSGSGAMPKADSAPKPAAVAMSSIALHPLLMGGQQGGEQNVEKNEKRAMANRYKPMAPKFSSVKANVGAPSASSGPVPSSSAVVNPYASSSTANPAAEEAVAPVRRSRKMHFAPQGKYVAQGDELRNAAKMEALKQRIADASKKAGLDSEFDTLERSLKVSSTGEVCNCTDD